MSMFDSMLCAFLLGIFIQGRSILWPFLFILIYLLFTTTNRRRVLLFAAVFLLAYSYGAFRGEKADFPKEGRWQVKGTMRRKGDCHQRIAYMSREYLLENFTKGKTGEVYSSTLRCRDFGRASFPGEFDEEGYFFAKGIQGVCTATEVSFIQKAPFYSTIPEKIRTFLYARTEDLSPSLKQMTRRILLGSAETGDKEMLTQMKDLGVAHLLAVSGLHVQYLFTWGLVLLYYPLGDRKLAAGFLFLVLFLYAYILSFPASILRATLFLCYQEAAKHLGMKENRRRRFLLSLSLVLFFFPFAYMDPGLALSFLCAMAIDLSKSDGRGLQKSLQLGIYINLFTFPVIVHRMGDFSLGVFLANLFLIPAFSVLFGAGLLYLVIGTVFLKTIYEVLFQGFTLLMQALLKLSPGIIHVQGGLTLSQWILYTAAVFLFIQWKREGFVLYAQPELRERKLREKTLWHIRRILYLWMILVLLLPMGQRMLPGRLTMLDVGQGDAFLFQSGSLHFLFDTGGRKDFRTGENVQAKALAKKLQAYGVSELHGVFLSHDDYDHAGNLSELKELLPIRRIYRSPGGEKREGEVFVKTGDRIAGKGFSIQVLDEGRFDSSDKNNAGMIILLDFGPKVLLLGDREAITDLPKADILKVAHHGSKKGTKDALLGAVQPSIALLSYGKDNRYGHPDADVLLRLEKRNILIYSTAGDREIQVFSLFGQMHVLTAKMREDILLLLLFFLLLLCKIYVNIYIGM